MHNKRKTQSDFIEEIRSKDSEFMKKFENCNTLKKVTGKDLFKPLGLDVGESEYDWYLSFNYFYSFRNVFEKAGFIIEPAYPAEIYPYYGGEYYIAKSPYEKARTRSSMELHLLLRAFIVFFLKENRDKNILNKFVDELAVNSKIQEIDVFRLKSYGAIFIKNKELRLRTFYSIVARNLISKKVRKKLALSVVNSLKNKSNCLEKKLFKNILTFFKKIDFNEAPEQLVVLDFQVTEKNKKYSFTGKTCGLNSLTPHNPYIDKSGNLKIDKKSVKNLEENTRKAQKVLKKHIKVDKLEEREIIKKKLPKKKSASANTFSHIKYLIRKNQWTAKEIEDYARKNGSMKMKFVLEINEYCDVNYGDFLLIEDENNFQINKYVLRSLNGSKENKTP